MRLDSQAVADVVVLAVKTATQPLQERIAVLEAQLAALGDVRDRLVTVETKAAILPPPAPPVPDLAPVLERLAVVETKAAMPLPVLPPEAGFDELRERIKALETRGEGPSPTDMGLVDVRERLGKVEARVTDDALTKEMGILRERVAVIEVKGMIPGPPGKDGADGKDGAPGLDGKDGAPGLAGLSFEGVYQEGKSYDLGNLVTWAGSSWHCNEPTTTKPGDGSKAWTLMVKRGRDGKDGQPGQEGKAGRDLTTKEVPAWRS